MQHPEIVETKGIVHMIEDTVYICKRTTLLCPTNIKCFKKKRSACPQIKLEFVRATNNDRNRDLVLLTLFGEEAECPVRGVPKMPACKKAERISWDPE